VKSFREKPDGEENRRATEENRKAQERVQIDWTKVRQDTRPQKGWWAPGGYIRVCYKCGQGFIGDKRAGHCSDCEYGVKTE
jgi:hypothetical protein